MVKNEKNFGLQLKELRESRGLSLRQVSYVAGVSSSYLSQVETGDRNIPTPKVLKKLAPVLGVTYDRIMTMAGYAANPSKKEEDDLDPHIQKIMSQVIGLRVAKTLTDSEKDAILSSVTNFIDFHLTEKKRSKKQKEE